MSIVLAFKFCHTKTVVLACNEIYLIKAIPSTNKNYIENPIKPIKYTNAYVFIEDLKKPNKQHCFQLQFP